MTLTLPLAVKTNEQGLPVWCRATVVCVFVYECVSLPPRALRSGRYCVD